MSDRSIQEWLSEISLAELIPVFESQGIQTLKSILNVDTPITDQNLHDWGIAKIGNRKKLLLLISKLKEEREKEDMNGQTVANSNQDDVIHPQAGTPLQQALQLAELSKQSPRLVPGTGPVFLSDLANIASMQAQHPLQIPNYRTGQPPPSPSNTQSDSQLSSPSHSSSIGNIPLNRNFSANMVQNFHAFTVPRSDQNMARGSFINSQPQQQANSGETPSIIWYKIKDATGNKRKRAANLSSLDTVGTPPDFVHNQLIYPFPAVHFPQRTQQPSKCIVKLYGKGPALADAPTQAPEDREYMNGLGADTEVSFQQQEKVFVFDKVKVIHLKKQDKHHRLFLFKFFVYDSNGTLLVTLNSEPFKILTHISQRGKDGTMGNSNEVKKPKKSKTPANQEVGAAPVDSNPPVSLPSTTPPMFVRLTSAEAIQVINSSPAIQPQPTMLQAQHAPQ